MLVRGKAIGVLALAALTGACFGPELKTKLVCEKGVAAEVFFSMFNSRGGKHGSAQIMPTDAAGVCQKMSEAAQELGLKVERVSPTVLVITGTDRVIIAYIHRDGQPFADPVVQQPVN